MGPVGSGKSTACVLEIWDRARRQAAFEGVRRTRWAVIRNHYPELLTTTVKTWKEWIPETECRLTYGTPIRGFADRQITVDGVNDGTRMEMEVYFLAPGS